MSSLIDELLAVAWPDGIPARLAPLIDRRLCTELLADFKLGLIFPFEDSARPVRLALSAQGEREQWQRAVAVQWPSEQAQRFLERVPPATRLMVDSDGSARAVIYLDDLQQVDHDLCAPHGLELMCATLEVPSGAEGRLTRHTEPPLDRLTGSLRPQVEHLLAQGAEGLWAIRWRDTEVESVLWITESRWRKNADASGAVVRSLGRHPGYDAALELLATHQCQGYPDAVDLAGDGAVDVTLGVLEQAPPDAPMEGT